MPRKATEAEKAIAREIPAVLCTLCRVEKARDAFDPYVRKTNGLSSWCRECRSVPAKTWLLTNKDMLRLRRQEKRKNNPEAIRLKDALARIANKPARQAANKRRYKENPYKVKAAIHAWKKTNPEKAALGASATKRAWRKNHPEKAHAEAMACYAKRQARKADVAYEKFSIKDAIRRDGPSCYICGIETDPGASPYTANKAELEHVIPLSKGGSHTRDNLRCACFRCNRIKNYRLTPEQTLAIVLSQTAMLVGGPT